MLNFVLTQFTRFAHQKFAQFPWFTQRYVNSI